jgi:probable HAF family extracellular repeat protein
MHRHDSRRSILRALAVALTAGSLFATNAIAAPTWSARILGTLRTDGTGISYAGGLNDAGVVVGGASTASGIDVFRWRSATGMSDRGMLVPPFASYGLSINSAETLCGYGLTQSSGFAGALRENPAGPITSLPRLAGGGDAYAYRIAETGVSVGWSNAGTGCGPPDCPGNPGHAAAWDTAGTLSLLPDLGGSFGVATDISPDGAKICGFGANGTGQVRAFRLVSHVATALPPLAGYASSQAWGINDVGQVVGWSETAGGDRRATLWETTAPIDLGVLPGTLGSLAIRINASGTIVGYAILPGSVDRATTFTPGSPPTDLNVALAAPSAWTLLYCNDVNASGQIVGQADSAGTERGFVLTPTATTAVEPGHAARRFDLHAPQPNPSRAGCSLRFSLAEAGPVRLDVLDLGGRAVARLTDAWLLAGDHAFEWDGRDARGDALHPGVFFVRLTVASRSVTRKLLIRR